MRCGVPPRVCVGQKEAGNSRISDLSPHSPRIMRALPYWQTPIKYMYCAIITLLGIPTQQAAAIARVIMRNGCVIPSSTGSSPPQDTLPEPELVRIHCLYNPGYLDLLQVVHRPDVVSPTLLTYSESLAVMADARFEGAGTVVVPRRARCGHPLPPQTRHCSLIHGRRPSIGSRHLVCPRRQSTFFPAPAHQRPPIRHCARPGAARKRSHVLAHVSDVAGVARGALDDQQTGGDHGVGALCGGARYTPSLLLYTFISSIPAPPRRPAPGYLLSFCIKTALLLVYPEAIPTRTLDVSLPDVAPNPRLVCCLSFTSPSTLITTPLATIRRSGLVTNRRPPVLIGCAGYRRR